MKHCLAVVVLALLLLGCATPPSGPKKIAIVGAKLVVRPGAAPLDYSIVIVEGGKIVAAGPQTSVPLPKDVEVVDGLGKIVEPLEATESIEAGGRANLVLKSLDDSSSREMREGEWLRK